MAEIIQINNNTYRIEDAGVRFFLLEGENKALLIDTGMNTPNAKEIVEEITKLPIMLVNTHGDIDHVSGNSGFEEFYIGENEVDYYKNKHNPTNRLITLKDQDIIDLGGRKLKIINLPGHTPGSIALLDINNRILIGGDSIQDGRIFMFGEGRDMNLFIQSLEKLWDEYQKDFDVIYPSHSSFPIQKDLIPIIIDCAKKIINHQTIGEKINFMNKEIVHYKFENVSFLCECDIK